MLSDLAGKDLRLPERAVMSRGPTTCPACGATNIMWGHAPDQPHPPEECHPLIWNEIDVLAETFMC
jgi:hypothetical protein